MKAFLMSMDSRSAQSKLDLCDVLDQRSQISIISLRYNVNVDLCDHSRCLHWHQKTADLSDELFLGVGVGLEFLNLMCR